MTENTPIAADQRRSKLALAVQQEVVGGGRVESQTDYSAILRFGNKPVNHTLQLILTLITCGAWGLVWLVLWIMESTSKKTITLSIDEFGNVLRQEISGK